jgi:hypothetical protein
MAEVRMEQIDAALADVREALEADGFELSVVPGDGARVTIEVKAGPNACAECLIPKDVFEQMVTATLGDDASTLTIVYPEAD